MFYVAKTEDAFDLPIPNYMSSSAAGMDLYANVDADVMIKTGEYKLIKTGIRIAIPDGYEAQIRPRSGLALNHGITILNSPGTIDADYRGEIKVIIVNFGNEGYIIKRGERIAQMVINKIERVSFVLCDDLDSTKRGEGGFGHSGK